MNSSDGNIGFVVTYCPSSWLKPCSLRGDVFWDRILNASRTFRWSRFSSTFIDFAFPQSNLSLQVFAWSETPAKSYFSFLMDFVCWSIQLETFNDVSPTFSTATGSEVYPRKAITRGFSLFFYIRIVFRSALLFYMVLELTFSKLFRSLIPVRYPR